MHFSRHLAGLIEAKAFPALIFSVIFFVLHVRRPDRRRSVGAARALDGPEDEIVERYRSVVEPYAGPHPLRGRGVLRDRDGAAASSSEWRDWILFSHATKFGVKDPQFHRDIGFYVFKLPFLEFIAGWTFAALLVILIVTLVFHYLNGGIRLQTPFQRVTPQVKVHISVILALMALTKTVQYYLARFGLTLSHRGVVDGATYTDVKAQLPALNLLMFISVAAAILFILNIFRRGWVFPIIAVGLWGFISIVVGTIYPAVIQRFVVQPNEYAREQTYIKRNITATRTAFGLDKIETKPFEYDTDLTPKTSTQPQNQETLDNARLWDPDPLGQVLPRPRSSSPSIRSPTSTSTATTSTASRRRRSAACASSTRRSCRATRGRTATSCTRTATASTPRRPTRTPATSRATCSPTSRRRRRAADSRSPTCTSARASPATRSSTARSPSRRPTARAAPRPRKYNGDGGVQGRRASRAGSRSRCASATSTSCTRARSPPQSRILYLRDIQERVQTAAPFLQWDADPYAVNLERQDRVGARRLHDARTGIRTRSRSTRPCRRAAVSNSDFNYVRNSVKATVDAYDGTIHFYVVDPTDPIIRTYEKAFPDLFDRREGHAGGPAARTGATRRTSSTRRPSSTRCTT